MVRGINKSNNTKRHQSAISISTTEKVAMSTSTTEKEERELGFAQTENRNGLPKKS